MDDERNHLKRAMLRTCPAKTEAMTKEQWLAAVKETAPDSPALEEFDALIAELDNRGLIADEDGRYFDPQKTVRFE